MPTWEELSEQQPTVVKMVANSLKKDRIAHAYLLEGGRGTGKQAVASQLAKSLFCKQKNEQQEPCGTCTDCRRIDSGNHPDVHFIEPDGQSIKIDQIRQLQKEFAYTGMESNKKVYILKHADKMTVQAANSLLKFLEEPSKMTVALLLTENVHRMLDTIISRCQVLSFRPLPPEGLEKALEQTEISRPVARLSAALVSDLAEAENLARDEWFVQARAIMIQLNEVFLQRPHQALLFIQNNWLQHFKDKEQQDRGLDLLLLWYKDLMYMQIDDEERIIYYDQLDLLKQQALRSSQKRITDQMTAVLEAKRRLGANMNPQLLMEQLVLRLQEG
ncbi:DNA polymerase III subunit delta' [Bacillus marinisedimentorum]|uniref:DNA polymerase III subunit delta' n=1 Tax=Bacillus marinisedimentorum TaxID=1821260 RepID=UPI0008720218|nr:DNA polymerase III subunit delta' [Bacillus marinisedimentorum]